MSETHPVSSQQSRQEEASPVSGPPITGEYSVNYIPETGKFEVMLDGELTEVSPMQAVLYALQYRYVVMSEVTAEKTRELQTQVQEIHQANTWLNAVTTAANGDEFVAPADSGVPTNLNAGEALLWWMDKYGLERSDYESPPSVENFKNAQIQISNLVDQLSSNNDLRLLSLKSTVAKAEQALTAADGVLQNIKRLMQMISNNMAQ